MRDGSSGLSLDGPTSVGAIFLQSTRKASMMCPVVIVMVAAPARRAGLTMSVHGAAVCIMEP